MNWVPQSISQAYAQARPVVPLLLIITACFIYFTSRYSISFNVAISDCLNSRVFLVDRWDKRIIEGQLVAFTMNVENEFYDTGDTWIKKVAAYGEQQVSVSPQHVSTAANTFRLSADYVLKKLGRDADALQSSWSLSEDELFMVGETITSLDSRFWGPIKRDSVEGRAYAIF
jgi:conjugal transfer pilin signal peptidase TrbI